MDQTCFTLVSFNREADLLINFLSLVGFSPHLHAIKAALYRTLSIQAAWLLPFLKEQFSRKRNLLSFSS